MPYVVRNSEGNIAELTDVPQGENAEWLESNDEQVQTFLKTLPNSKEMLEALANLDTNMARVVEDLLDILIEKGVFNYTELPEAAQNKLFERRKLRDKVSAISNLIGEEDDIL